MMFLYISQALAAGGDHSEIPWGYIGIQAFNFGILVLLLFFLLKNKIKTHFTDRRASYELAVQKAKAAKEEAEARQKEIEAKIKSLKAGREEAISKARTKAEKEKVALVQEAEATASRMRDDVKRTFQSQVDSSRTGLMAWLLNTSLTSTEEILTQKMKEEDHTSLQKNILNSMGASK